MMRAQAQLTLAHDINSNNIIDIMLEEEEEFKEIKKLANK